MDDDLGGRGWEWDLLQPLVGRTMLELGNKRKENRDKTPLVYKEFFEVHGFRHVSVDINGRDGALPLDLSKPLNLGTFDMVTNIGTSEHVSEDDWAGQIACWRNIVEAMHVGSVLVSITPLPGSYRTHATWYPCLTFFERLAELNGLEVERLYGAPHGWDRNTSLVYARLRRVASRSFEMPDKQHMFLNR